MRLTLLDEPREDEPCNPERFRGQTWSIPNRFARVLYTERGSAHAGYVATRRLSDELRGQRTASEGLLAKSAAAFADGDAELGRALADLCVSGFGAYRSLRARVPSDAEIAMRLRTMRPGLDDGARNRAAGQALDRMFAVAWALRRGVNRPALGWVACCAEDDRLDRPVNVPHTPYPQCDLEVRVRPFRASTNTLTVRTRYSIMRRDVPAAPRAEARTLPEDPSLRIEPGERVLVFVHGHSSRLEEVETLVEPLTSRGYTVVSMDLPSCGYAEMIDHRRVAPDDNTDRWDWFPMLDFLEQFVIDFVDTLGDLSGHDIRHQIAGFIGGSLGGNLSLRLATRDIATHPHCANVIAWSPASLWTPYGGADDLGRETGPNTARAHMLEPENRDTSRAEYMQQVFYYSFRTIDVRPQPEYWYRDDADFAECKSALIAAARADREEMYCPEFRRCHWRIALEQMVFSHRVPRENSAKILGRTLLAVGSGDNYNYSNIFDAAQKIAVDMVNTPGRTLWMNKTGHSFHVERPREFCNHVDAFLPPLRPGDSTDTRRLETWTSWQSLGGSCGSDPVVATNEDGRFELFARHFDGSIVHAWQSGGGWSVWAPMSGGLDGNDQFIGAPAVGQNQDGRLEVFATLQHVPWVAHTWQKRANSDWNDWDKGNHFRQLIGGATDGVAVIERAIAKISDVENAERLLLLVSRRTNGQICVRGQDRVGGWWGHVDLPSSAIDFRGRPAAARNQDRRVEIFARGVDNQLRHIWENGRGAHGAGGWYEAWAERGRVTSDPAVALDGRGRLRVFARGTRGELTSVRQTRPNNGWGSWEDLGGELHPDSAPAVARGPWGGLQVFVRWADDSVRTRREIPETGEFTPWQNLGGSTVRTPAVAPAPNGMLTVFAVRSDGSTWWTRHGVSPLLMLDGLGELIHARELVEGAAGLDLSRLLNSVRERNEDGGSDKSREKANDMSGIAARSAVSRLGGQIRKPPRIDLTTTTGLRVRGRKPKKKK
jgi:hypothetical protein